jgi:hypothetical protein
MQVSLLRWIKFILSPRSRNYLSFVTWSALQRHTVLRGENATGRCMPSQLSSKTASDSASIELLESHNNTTQHSKFHYIRLDNKQSMGWQLEAQPLLEWDLDRYFSITFDILLLALALLFGVYGVIVKRYEGSPVTDDIFRLLTRVSNLVGQVTCTDVLARRFFPQFTFKFYYRSALLTHAIESRHLPSSRSSSPPSQVARSNPSLNGAWSITLPPRPPRPARWQYLYHCHLHHPTQTTCFQPTRRRPSSHMGTLPLRLAGLLPHP